MKIILGFLLLAIFICVGAYVGGYLLFTLGIIQFIHGISSTPIEATDIGIGVARVILAYFAAQVIWMVGVIIAGICISMEK